MSEVISLREQVAQAELSVKVLSGANVLSTSPEDEIAINDRFNLRRYCKQVGDRDHMKVFANEEAAETWLQENDPEGWRSSMK